MIKKATNIPLVEISPGTYEPAKAKWDFPVKSSNAKTRPAQFTDQERHLVHNPFAALEDKADPSVPTATLQIYQYINEYLTRKPDSHVNRASSATMCHKRRWFQRNGAPGESLTPRKLVNFTLGEMTEKVLLFYIKNGCVGPDKLYSEVDFGKVTGTFQLQGKEIEIYEQDDLTVEIPGLSELVTAHVDGWGKRNSDGQWELIEIKSAANYGFKDFKEVGPKDYLKQSTVNLMTNRAIELGATQVRFFYLRKETGHVWDQLYSFAPDLWQEVIAGYQVSNQKEEPKAPFMLVDELERKKPTGRRIAQFPCTYCPYLKLCHGSYEVDWKSDQFGFLKPVYVFKGEKK